MGLFFLIRFQFQDLIWYPLFNRWMHSWCHMTSPNKYSLLLWLSEMGVSKNRGGPPKSSILIGFSLINHPFWGTTIFGNTQIWSSWITSPKFLRISSKSQCSQCSTTRRCVAPVPDVFQWHPAIGAHQHREGDLGSRVSQVGAILGSSQKYLKDEQWPYNLYSYSLYNMYSL